MNKNKKPAVEAFDKQGDQNVPEGYTWCPACQASFQGEVCPGCVDLSGAQSGEKPPQPDTINPDPPPNHPAPPVGAVQEAGCAVHQFIKNEDGPFVCEKCGLILGEGELPDPATLAEVAEQASTETTTITEILPVPLTDADYKEFGIKMGLADQEVSLAEDELDSVKAQYKSRIVSAKGRRNEYSAIINAGHQQRQVECHLVKDFAANTITLIRLDTGETVRTRTMTAAEKQRGLNFEDQS